jgi:hypothetical protein
MKRNKKLITHLHRRVRGRRQSDDGKGSSMSSRIRSQVATPDLTDREAPASSQPPTPAATPSRQPLACKWVDVRFSVRLHARWPRGLPQDNAFPMSLTAVGTPRRDVPARSAAGGTSGLRR